MKTMLLAIVVFAVSCPPSFAANMQRPDAGSMTHSMQHDHGAKMEMMHAPQFLLMMAYHRNLIGFARALDKIAHHAETVPPEYARTAVSEMRHSVEQLEKYRADFVPEMKGGKGPEDMKKKMDERLVKVKIELRALEDLTKQDTIPSQTVKKHVQEILEVCEGMDHGNRHGKGDRCGEKHGRGMGCGETRERDCECHEMTSEHHLMIEEGMREVKAQDAELATLVENMNRAPQDNKLNLLADIVTRIVQQRAAMTAHMEKMMQMHMRHKGGARMSSPMMNNAEDEDADNDEDADMNDTDYADTPGFNE